MKTRFAAIALGAMSVLATYGVAQDDGEQLATTMPDFGATGVHQMPATKNPMSVYGGRLVVMTYMASWSDRCVEEVKHLNKLENKWAGRGLSILAVHEEDIEPIRTWAEEQQAVFGFAAVDALTYEKLAKAGNVPGLPHAVIVAVDGTIKWRGHPREVKKQPIASMLVGVRTPPPRLPEALAKEEVLLAEGKWGDARAALVESKDGLDKISKQWAVGLISWVDDRRGTWLEEAAALREKKLNWDAWQMYDDFPRRFAGLDGSEDAQARAAEIRKDPDAARGLEAGDLVQRARDKIAEGDNKRASLILSRVVRTYKSTPHAARAKELLRSLP